MTAQLTTTTEFFDEIVVGQRRPPSRRRLITRSDIEDYCDLSGDWSGSWGALFSDEAGWEATRFTEDRQTAPAMLVLSAQYGLSRTIGSLNGIVALYVWEELEYLRPVRAGDTIRFEWEVVKKQADPRRAGYGTVWTKRTILNQRDEVVMKVVERTRYRSRAIWEGVRLAGGEALGTREMP